MARRLLRTALALQKARQSGHDCYDDNDDVQETLIMSESAVQQYSSYGGNSTYSSPYIYDSTVDHSYVPRDRKPRLVKWHSCSQETHLRGTERHLPYGITRCYLPQDAGERAPPKPHPDRLVLDLPTQQGWQAELTLLLGYMQILELPKTSKLVQAIDLQR